LHLVRWEFYIVVWGLTKQCQISDIFGIANNSVAIDLPLLGSYPAKYKNPEAGQRKGNMLTPIFGRPHSGAGYDPLIGIIWKLSLPFLLSLLLPLLVGKLLRLPKVVATTC
jgi:hypothetical protein